MSRIPKNVYIEILTVIPNSKKEKKFYHIIIDGMFSGWNIAVPIDANLKSIEKDAKVDSGINITFKEDNIYVL